MSDRTDEILFGKTKKSKSVDRTDEILFGSSRQENEAPEFDVSPSFGGVHDEGAALPQEEPTTIGEQIKQNPLSALTVTSRLAGQGIKTGQDVLTNLLEPAFGGEFKGLGYGVDLEKDFSQEELVKAPFAFDRIKEALGDGVIGTGAGIAGELLIPTGFAKLIGAAGSKATEGLRMKKKIKNIKLKRKQARNLAKATADIEGKEIQNLRQQVEGILAKGEDTLNIPIESIKNKTIDTVSKLGGEGEDLLRRRFFSNIDENRPDIGDLTKKSQIELNEYYKQISNEESVAKADLRIAENPTKAHRYVLAEKTPSAEHTATSLRLMDYYEYLEKKGIDTSSEIAELVNDIAPKLTQMGQAIQAASIYGRMTPSGAQIYAQRYVDKFNKLNPKNAVDITDQQFKNIRSQAETITEMSEGWEKAFASSKLIKSINELVPRVGTKAFLEKTAMTQTIAQLLNPKTIIRNLGGNAGFSIGENISDVLATPIDKIIGKFTGKRTKALPSVAEQFKGLVQGLKEGTKEALAGVNVNQLGTKFDIPAGEVFQSKFGKGMQKALSIALRAPDKAFYKMAYRNELKNLMKLNGAEKPTAEMIEQAHYAGLFRTFQDNSLLAKSLSNLKSKVFNVGQPFGFGDLVIKYPRTPANLLNRGFSYSPAGFAKTAFEAIKPMVGKDFNQKAFVESFSRALVGSTSLVGTGALLHNYGILTLEGPKSGIARDLQRSVGIKPYSINATAFKRLVYSGFDKTEAKFRPGDKMVTYDWFQPFAFPVVMGASMNDGWNNETEPVTNSIEVLGRSFTSLFEGVDALTQTPLLTGVRRFARNPSIGKAFAETVAQAPRTFIPTLIAQMRFYSDKNLRDIFDDDTVMGETKQILRQVTDRIPWASKMLSPRLDQLGQEQVLIDDEDRTVFNVFFNPAITGEISDDPAILYMWNLQQRTGTARHVPNIRIKDLTLNGNKIKPTPEQRRDFIYQVGNEYKKLLDRMLNNKSFVKANPHAQVSKLSGRLNKIRAKAKKDVFGKKPKKQKVENQSIKTPDIETILQTIQDQN